jgi:hemoglobin
MTNSPTLFDRLGGIPALRAAVDEFYKRLLADPKLFAMFDDVKMPLLKTHQLAFMKVAFSKIPDTLDVPQLIFTKHMRLFLEKGLNETHFDLVAQHLVETLQHLKIQPNLIDSSRRPKTRNRSRCVACGPTRRD